MPERDALSFDVVIVGAGPSGLAAACRLAQMSRDSQMDLSICVVEKGSEVGAHILSGAVVETRALNELFPDWRTRHAPLTTPVARDEFVFLLNERKAVTLPCALVPRTLHNQGNYVVSLGNLCRWMAEQAEGLGVEVISGYPASELLIGDAGEVVGVTTGDMGVAADGGKKDGYTPGTDLFAKYTLFAEGCRGHLGKQLQALYRLNDDADAQHYAIGIKELWDIDPAKHRPGLVIHGAGWPLGNDTGGGFFLYHAEDNQAVVGLIVDLNYRNPWLSPFDEFQRLKHHPQLAEHLSGGKRISYGARAIAKGGINALPRMHFAGGLLLGCDAGTLNVAKIKGTHTAMKSGMLAADEVFDALRGGDDGGRDLQGFGRRFRNSWLYDELYAGRNFGPALHKFGTFLGGAFNLVDQNIFRGKLPFTVHDTRPDHDCLKPVDTCSKIAYPKPDGVLSFDRLTSVYLSNTAHEEDQPCHLRLHDPLVPLSSNLPIFAEPAQRYCPAGVYEVVDDEGGRRLQINAQNCVHCKTCDIKDPAQNITWWVPEGGGGPNYPNM